MSNFKMKISIITKLMGYILLITFQINIKAQLMKKEIAN